MFEKISALGLWAAFAVSLMAADNPPAKLSATEIADKNAAARGGFEAWHSVKTLVLVGNGRRRESEGYARSAKHGLGRDRHAKQLRAVVAFPFRGRGAVALPDGIGPSSQNAL